MTDEETQLVVSKITEAVKIARRSEPSKKGWMEWANLIITIIGVFFIGGICTLGGAWLDGRFKLEEQNVTIAIQKTDSDAKDAYVAQPIYTATVNRIYSKLNDHETRLNADDTKIALLQNGIGSVKTSNTVYTAVALTNEPIDP